MDVVDLYLYGGFAAGWLVGRWRPSRSPWVGRATIGAVLVLLGLLGASFRAIAPGALADVLPWAVAFATAILAATAAVFLGLRALGTSRVEPGPPAPPPAPERFPTSALLVVALLMGYVLGREVVLPTTELIPAALTVLLVLVGYGIELSVTSVRRAWVPLASATLGVVLVAGAFAAIDHLAPVAVWATGLGFGWYSLTGPLVAARLGAGLGLFAFLTNFVREGLTMVLAPYAGRRLGGEGLAALGGATAMDTTLYFVVRYGDQRAGALAVASGLTLTVVASLVVPLVLTL